MIILESTCQTQRDTNQCSTSSHLTGALETYIQVFNALPQIRNNSIERQVGILIGDITFRSHSKFHIMTWINF